MKHISQIISCSLLCLSGCKLNYGIGKYNAIITYEADADFILNDATIPDNEIKGLTILGGYRIPKEYFIYSINAGIGFKEETFKGAFKKAFTIPIVGQINLFKNYVGIGIETRIEYIMNSGFLLVGAGNIFIGYKFKKHD